MPPSAHQAQQGSLKRGVRVEVEVGVEESSSAVYSYITLSLAVTRQTSSLSGLQHTSIFRELCTSIMIMLWTCSSRVPPGDLLIQAPVAMVPRRLGRSRERGGRDPSGRVLSGRACSVQRPSERRVGLLW